MSSESYKSNGSIIEKLKLALKESRHHYGRNEKLESKRIALEARDEALAEGLGLNHDAKVFEAQVLLCDKKWDEVILRLSGIEQYDFHMLGFARDRLGAAYDGKKEYDKAIEYYQKALDTPGYDTPGMALNNIGNAYSGKKDYDKAIEYYQKALDTPGYDTPWHGLNNMGNAYYGKKEYDKAIEYYQKALDTPGYDASWHGLNNMGNAYYGKKEYDKAIEYYQKALDTPEYDTPSMVLYNIGNAYYDKKDYDKAIEYYQKALDTPGYDTPGTALYNMGLTYYDKKDYDKAIEYYQKALDTPGYDTPGTALNNMGNAYYGKKEYDKAIEYHQKALDTPGYNIPGMALYNMGNAYYGKKEYDKAIEYYQKALDTPGYNIPGMALYNMGNAYYGKKDYGKAIEYYQKALDTPDYNIPGMALYNMGNAYYGKKDYGKAIEYYQKALDTPGYNIPGTALYNMGLTYSDKKDYDKAIIYMKRATQEFDKTNDTVRINQAKEIINFWKRTNRAAKKGLNMVAQEFDDVASALAASSRPGADVAADPFLRRLIKRAGARTTAFAEYARQQESVKNDVLVVLKGWSPAIPIIAEANSEAFGGQLCRGGGYFIKAAKHGIALDPGYDYLRNLWSNGYHIKEINTVIVTHNHPDHQDDLCRIAGLDYEYRRNISGSSDKSKIRYYLDQDTERASEPTLASLNANPVMIKQVDIDNKECRITSGLCLDVFKTKHGNGKVVGAPFGTVLKLKLQDGTDCRIGYTSDTCYFDDLPDKLKDCDIMICHFSSASTDEFNDPEKLHSAHLGFNGLIKLIDKTNAKLYIVSEFWGGVGDQRYDLVEYLKNEFALKGREVKIVAGDIGLTIDLKTLGIYCRACGKPWPFHDVRIVEPSSPYDGLRYFCKECPTSSTNNG